MLWIQPCFPCFPSSQGHDDFRPPRSQVSRIPGLVEDARRPADRPALPFRRRVPGPILWWITLEKDFWYRPRFLGKSLLEDLCCGRRMGKPWHLWIWWDITKQHVEIMTGEWWGMMNSHEEVAHVAYRMIWFILHRVHVRSKPLESQANESRTWILPFLYLWCKTCWCKLQASYAIIVLKYIATEKHVLTKNMPFCRLVDMFLKHFTWQGPKLSMDRLHHLDAASIWRGVMVLFANRIADLLQAMVGKTG